MNQKGQAGFTELTRDGQIASFQVGGRRMFLRAALDAFFAKIAKVA